MITVSVAIFSICLLILLLADPRPGFKFVVGMSGFLVLVLSATELVSDRLTGNGFNEAVVYHLRVGLSGAGFGDFSSLIKKTASVFVICFTILLGAIYFAPIRSTKLFSGKGSKWLGPIMAMCSVLCHPTLKKIIDQLWPRQNALAILEDFVEAKPLPINSPKPSFIWIYGESLERTFLDQQLFPGLMPEIEALEKSSVNFTNIDQYFASGWTIAGIVASQCGVPLLTLGSLGNSLGSLPLFLPRAVCIGDLLAPLGYQLDFLGGAETAFAGKGRFLQQHGFQGVYGLQELSKNVPHNERNYWGLNDDDTFDLVYQRFLSLRQSTKPFGLVTLTLATHPPEGNIPKSCGGIKYQHANNQFLNAVHCSDHLIGDLVRKIRIIDKNIPIIVSSDHLAMRNPVSDTLESGTRRNLFLINSPGRLTPTINNRAAGTYSAGVTVLDALGFEIKELGFGRSLLGTEDTLAERYTDFSIRLQASETGLSKLWDLPNGLDDLAIDIRSKFAFIGRNSYPLPLLAKLSSDGDIVRLEFSGEDRPLASLAAMESARDLLWIDHCKVIGESIKDASNLDAADFCVWNGHANEVVPVTAAGKIYLSKGEILGKAATSLPTTL